MFDAHSVLHSVALGGFVLCAAAVWVPKAGPLVRRSAWIATLAVLTLSLILRWVVTGHPPLFGTFENTSAAAWGLALLVSWRLWDVTGRPRASTRILALWVPVTLAYGVFFSREPLPLTISERSLLVDVHVLFAWVAYALLLEGAMEALVGLVGRADDESERLIVRSSGVGFAVFSAMIAVGAWYSYRLFGQWYKWEIVETLSLAAWLAYGAVLHVRLMLGWRGRKLYAVVVAALPLLLLSYWVWSVYSRTYHFFDITVIRPG